MAAVPIPLLDAARAKERGTISWDEYIHNLLARCAGIKHEDDDREGEYLELQQRDPFGHSIWTWSNKVEILKDTAPLEAVFKAYRYGVLDDVKTKLASLDGVLAEAVKKSLALLALQERKNDVLKFCLDEGGFRFERAFWDEANRVRGKKDLETFNILEQSEFRRCHPRGIGAPPGVEASFDIGGRFPVDW